jgi:Fe-Mn family superoxide dismutase
MSDVVIGRRSFLAGSTALVAASSAAAQSVTSAATEYAPSAPPYAPSPIALPFPAASLGWLSEKLIVSHHDNNYVGAVKRLGGIHAEFARTDPLTAPGFTINGLKREELIAWNSMILHELYFAGLGAPSQPSARLGQQIEHDFGSYDRWSVEFSAMGKALAGGSGWVLLAWSLRDRRLTNQWAADHTMTLAGSTPILALDMYEHAYAIDFGAKAAAYVDGYMKNIAWAEAGRRFAGLQPG